MWAQRPDGGSRHRRVAVLLSELSWVAGLIAYQSRTELVGSSGQFTGDIVIHFVSSRFELQYWHKHNVSIGNGSIKPLVDHDSRWPTSGRSRGRPFYMMLLHFGSENTRGSCSCACRTLSRDDRRRHHTIAPPCSHRRAEGAVASTVEPTAGAARCAQSGGSRSAVLSSPAAHRRAHALLDLTTSTRLEPS